MERKEFIAKTDPEIETIQQHTDRLLENLIFSKIISRLKSRLGFIKTSMPYHDLGK